MLFAKVYDERICAAEPSSIPGELRPPFFFLRAPQERTMKQSSTPSKTSYTSNLICLLLYHISRHYTARSADTLTVCMLNTAHLYIHFNDLFIFFFKECVYDVENIYQAPFKGKLRDLKPFKRAEDFLLTGIRWEVTAVCE